MGANIRRGASGQAIVGQDGKIYGAVKAITPRDNVSTFFPLPGLGKEKFGDLVNLAVDRLEQKESK